MTYSYQVSSSVRRVRERSELLLGTSGGRTEAGPAVHPYLFQGFLTEPRPAALGMLACAAVARARYYTPASVIAALLADPVVTSHDDRLRFESFSSCCAASLAPALFPQAAALGLQAAALGLQAAARGLGAGSAERPMEVRRPPAQAQGRPPETLPPSLDDPAELVRLLTQLMEDASDALAVERAMAGAVRLCGLPPAERARLATPLLKRAGERLREDYDGPFGGREIASDIAGLTLAWGSGRAPDVRAARRVWGSDYRATVLRSGLARTMAGILTARLWEASALAAEGHQVQTAGRTGDRAWRDQPGAAARPARLLDGRIPAPA
jgi:hypothetical protein